MAKRPTINKIKPDIKNLTIYLRSQKKFGKSTLFRDTIISKYGDPTYGLLIKCGSESGDTMLDEVNSVQVETYQDMLDIKHWLLHKEWIERDAKGKVIGKEPLDHHIQIVAFDTVDEMCLLTDAETIRQSNVENPTKRVKSIKAAMGGYTAGEKYSANNVIKPYINEIKKAGFGVWGIAHTKFKQIREKGGLEEDGYMQLTSNLAADYESAFGDIFDVVLTGVIDKQVEEKEDSKGKSKKYATGEVRKLYFRGTTLIDAGGRFAMDSVPEYMIFDKPDMAADFIKVVEEGMEKSKKSFTTKSTKKAKPQPTKPEIEEPIKVESDPLPEGFEDETDDMFDDVLEETTTNEYPEDLFEVIKDSIKTLPKDKKVAVAKKVKEFGKLTDVPEEGLKEIFNMINE